MKNGNIDHGKELIIGILGSIPGMIAMTYYWKAIAALPKPQVSHKQEQPNASISLIGQHHEEGESATAAMGRIAYHVVTGKEPQSKEMRAKLSTLADWGIGIMSGGLYGAIRKDTGMASIMGGLFYATGLWLFADELAVPLMGLSNGPQAFPPLTHVEGLGAHLVYGLVTSTTAGILDKLF